MIEIPNYRLEDKLFADSRTRVYRGIRTLDDLAVIVKTPAAEYPSREVLGRLKHEYEVNRKISTERIVRALDFCRYDRGVAVVFENNNGVSLKRRLQEVGGRIGLVEFFSLAIDLARGLEEVHRAGVIHKDLKPSNIIVIQDSAGIKINDFGLATLLTRESAENFIVDGLQGTLAYISPEQTGRMNRDVDYRSDYYSLGVTLYEILVGSRPFRVTDPMAMMHCHIARDPEPPHLIHPEIPEALSRVLLKLLAKTPEDRYQSTQGMIADLQELQRPDGSMTDFTPGRHDASERFQIPQKLYGREKETANLMSHFHSASRGGSELLLVTGYSGIGKSSVINEIHKPVVESHGFFIAGKFDQYKRDIPYAAFIAAFQNLIRQVLAESPEVVEKFRDRLSRALSAEGQVIIEVIPEVELLIGRQPPVPALDTVEALNRLSQCFRRFTAVFAALEHPLVFFIDDLQWADIPSLNLMRVLLTADDVSHMLILGAFRDNEIGPGHPLPAALEELRAARKTFGTIHLSPLDENHLRDMLGETLRSQPEEVRELARLIKKKTAGNPFFARQLLNSLYTERLLRLDPALGRWIYDLDRIQALDNTENVLDLMVGKLDGLRPVTRKTVLLAACVGGHFDLGTLATVGETPPVEVSANLAEALQEGLILPIGEDYKYVGETRGPFDYDAEAFSRTAYRFLHDRVHQAAYGLLDRNEKRAIHRRIGELLLDRLPAKALDERLFEVVEHLNRAADLLTAREERLNLARRNLDAGNKAMRSAAFNSALTYLRQATKLLDEEAWSDNQELAWSVNREIANCLFSTARLEEAESHILLALPRTVTEEQKVNLYQVYLKVLFQMNRHQDAVLLTREALKFLGVSLPKKIGKAHVGMQFIRFRLSFGSRPVKALLDLPRIENQRMLNVCKVIYDSIPSTYIVSPDIMAYLCVLIARICLRHGNSIYAPFAYTALALIPAGVTKEFKLGEMYTRTGIELTEKYPDQDSKGRSHFLAGFASSWRRPIGESLAHGQTARQCFHETGNIHWANYSVTFTRTQSILYQEKNLAEIDRENVDFYYYHLPSRDREVIQNQYFLLNFIRNLRGVSTEDVPNEYNFDAVEYEAEMATPGNVTQRAYYFSFRMIEAYTAEDYESAFRFARASFRIIFETLGLLLDHSARYYYVLTLLAQRDRLSWKQRLATKIPYALNKLLLRHAARNCPANFQSQYLLVQAEEARGAGRISRALDLYDRALDAARNQKFPQQIALCNELTGKFYLSIGQSRPARLYLTEALFAYDHWGANAKVRQLHETYGGRLGDLRPANRIEADANAGTNDSISSDSTATESSRLDMDTVLKAARTVSGEIKREKLLERMMQILIENAGAERGLLVLEREGRLYVEAEEDASTGQVKLMQSVPIETAGNVCRSVVRLVQNSMKSVVLANATREGDFQNDEYVRNSRIKSILCAPIVYQGRSRGVVYLENNLAEGAFTADRLRTVNVISSQAAIALENANLYADLENLNRDLEQKVNRRTEQLRVSRDRAEQAYAEIEELNAISRRLHATTDFDQVVDQIFAHITSAFDIEVIWLLQINEERTELYATRMNFDRGNERELFQDARLPLAPESGIFYKVYNGKKPFYMRRMRPGLLKNNQFARERLALTDSFLLVPLIIQGEAIGIVCFANITHKLELSREALASLTRFSEQVAGAIQSSSLIKNIQAERKKSDGLLLNILPGQVAKELKKYGEVEPVLYSSVSVMFTDFVGFTRLASTILPHQLVEELNGMFLQFDEICERHGIEKLKTIGDAYMAAGGIPKKNSTHPVDLCMAALEIQAFMTQIGEIKKFQNTETWQLRLGIHTGPVIAGVIGKNKFAYDVWGDAVNVASRMETAGEPGRINISDATHALVKPFFETENRGPIQVKNRGELEMYFLNRLRPELSADDEGRRPNAAFWKLFADLPGH